MINDTLARRELNRRLACVLGELEDLGENSMGLLPYEQACRRQATGHQRA
jgi:hypothetical protein